MDQLPSLYQFALKHRKTHHCGGVPYEQSEILIEYSQKIKPVRILEIGTGVGFTTAVLSFHNPQSHIDTIDKDPIHLQIAKEQFQAREIADSITLMSGKARDIIVNLYKHYDLIFFDAYTPQVHLLPEFGRLLTPKGVLITANLFLINPDGGRYLKTIQDESKWETKIISNTAISLRS